MKLPLLHCSSSYDVYDFKCEVRVSYCNYRNTAQKKTNSTIHQVSTMLATSKNVLFPGCNHLLTIGTDDPSL